MSITHVPRASKKYIRAVLAPNLQRKQQNLKFSFTEWPFSDLGRSPTTTPMEHSSGNTYFTSQIVNIILHLRNAWNNRVFMPRWGLEYLLTDPESFKPDKWTCLYDHLTLIKTRKTATEWLPPSRLIVTAVNVLTAEPLTFDSVKQQITSREIA